MAWSGFVWCWEVLVASYYLPGWGWLLLLILACVGLVNIYRALKGESEEPEFKSYIEDFIHGAKWRWVWVENRISKVWCFCPRCDATLVDDDSSCRSLYAGVNKTDFICENCGRSTVASIAGGSKGYAIGAIRAR